MNLKINYRGDLGFGSTEIEIDNKSLISDLINLFHKQIGISASYNIGAGAPPFRRTISVSYEYRINSRRVTEKNISESIDLWGISNNDNLIIKVDGGGKVD